MNYPFLCGNKNCKNYNKIVNIQMRITEYTPHHLCPECKTEMKRDPQSLCCGMSIDKTNSFFRRCN